MIDQAVRDLSEHSVSFERMALDSLLHSVEEDEVTEKLTIENYGELIVGIESMGGGSQRRHAEEELYRIEEELKALTVAGFLLKRVRKMEEVKFK